MKSVVFTYGRFNPPHKGHRLMIEQVIETARRTNKMPVIVVSHSVGNARNPLPVENKMRILRRWFPGVTIISSSKEKSIAKITQEFNKNSIMIVGQNRENSFKFLDFKKVTVPRTVNAPSATMARAAATAGNKVAFKNMTGYSLTNNIRNKIVKAVNKKR